MVDKEVLQRKLQKMQEYLDEIELYRDLAWHEYQTNRQVRRAVERLIQLNWVWLDRYYLSEPRFAHDAKGRRS